MNGDFFGARQGVVIALIAAGGLSVAACAEEAAIPPRADFEPTPLLAFALHQACANGQEGNDFQRIGYSQATFTLAGESEARGAQAVFNEAMGCWKGGNLGCEALTRCPQLALMSTDSVPGDSCEGIVCEIAPSPSSSIACHETLLLPTPVPGNPNGGVPTPGPAICGVKTGCTEDRCEGDVKVRCDGGVESREDCKFLDPTLKCQLSKRGPAVCANGFLPSRNDCEGTVAHSTDETGGFTVSFDCARIGARCELRNGDAHCAL